MRLATFIIVIIARAVAEIVIPKKIFSRKVSFVNFMILKFIKLTNIAIIDGRLRATVGTNWDFETGKP